VAVRTPDIDVGTPGGRLLDDLNVRPVCERHVQRKALEMANEVPEHEHSWEPAPEFGLARYRCACGTHGYRYAFGRNVAIKAYRNGPPRQREHEPDREPTRKPSLDYYDGTPRH
jgi:hypothetical protein